MFDTYLIEEDRLSVGKPKGVLDAQLARGIVEFVEIKEVEVDNGFNRSCDMRGLESANRSLDEVEAIAERRRAFNLNMVHVKSAFLATNTLLFGLCCMYQALLESPRIEVKAVRSLEEAAEWLYVPRRFLTL